MTLTRYEPSDLRQRLRRASPCSMTAAATVHGTAALKSAAVLVPLVFGAEPSVLLTRRCSTLTNHAGQVSLPGGRIDPEDEGPEAAALREAREEIALDSRQVELVGRLPDHVTSSGYRVTPVLGLLPPGLAMAGLSLRPSAREVDAVFELPLSVLLDPDSPRRHSAVIAGQARDYWVWPHPEHYIWGATAAILVDLATCLREALCRA